MTEKEFNDKYDEKYIYYKNLGYLDKFEMNK